VEEGADDEGRGVVEGVCDLDKAGDELTEEEDEDSV
jgi:hypothetical protein